MGTRGYWVFRFNGRYYAFYSQFDTYPECLGAALVDQIPKDHAEYQQWLKEKRGEFAFMAEAMDRELLTVPEQKLDSKEAFASIILPNVAHVVEERCESFRKSSLL